MRNLLLLLVTVTSCQMLLAQYSPYRVQEDLIDPRHPIDIKYEGKLDFLGGNTEMEINIQAAQEDWWNLMKEKEAALMKALTHKQRSLFEDAQKKWEEAYEADVEFFFASRERLRYMVGREGEICCKKEFMNRVRKRALDLSEYTDIFIEEN